MAKVVDKLCAACPEAIVDFDITEGGRYVGLGFLAAGKYFLINNGPYYPSLDVPYDWRTATTWSNVFVYPGPARARVCRAPLDFDKWIPSVLFLTHYLPDDPAGSQRINLASLVLGQNGIWGDLLGVSEAGVALFGQVLGLYKQVRDDITAAAPVRSGIVGGSPEVHEKILPATGRGVVAVFAGAAGRYTYVTANRVAATHWAAEGVTVTRDPAGRARLECEFRHAGAHLVFFGVR
jgi:alpha-galactosidase